ncbi:hypothetical protein [Streptosporangium roseum]|uniref:hypothetical protein n=1 Tax=Streptosporangium roseum TaxID=2001 RepID=UPI0004CD8863|nr:hypothetical protein [Streptosporangium roseum]
MESNGFSYSTDQLHGLAGGIRDTAVKLCTVHDRSEEAMASTRAALGEDEFAHAYWQSGGKRLATISEILDLLKKAVDAQEPNVRLASANYRASDEAGTIRE